MCQVLPSEHPKDSRALLGAGGSAGSGPASDLARAGPRLV